MCIQILGGCELRQEGPRVAESREAAEQGRSG